MIRTSPKFVLAGGGSGGPTAPLLAIAQELKKEFPSAKFLFIGTKDGVEKHMAKRAGINFDFIPAAKLRRYLSWRNFFVPGVLLFGLIKSFGLLRKFKPDCIIGVGSFVQVPVIWSGWLLKIPSLIHQQDLMPSLANQLCQFAAKKITVSLEPSVKDFSTNFGLFYTKPKGQKILFTGNPVRDELFSADKKNALAHFRLKDDMPVLLVLGGGTGSNFINQLVLGCLPQLLRIVQVIHSAGGRTLKKVQAPNYRQVEFLERMDLAYAAADIVLSRAGMSTIAELSALKKVSIIIPLPNTHQEINAWFLQTREAALILKQGELLPEDLPFLLRKLIFEHGLQTVLKKNIYQLMPHDSAKEIVSEIKSLLSLNAKS